MPNAPGYPAARPRPNGVALGSDERYATAIHKRVVNLGAGLDEDLHALLNEADAVLISSSVGNVVFTFSDAIGRVLSTVTLQDAGSEFLRLRVAQVNAFNATAAAANVSATLFFV